jgi:hypothetical protein
MTFADIALYYIYVTAIVFAVCWDHDYDFKIRNGWMGL